MPHRYNLLRPGLKSQGKPFEYGKRECKVLGIGNYDIFNGDILQENRQAYRCFLVNKTSGKETEISWKIKNSPNGC